MAPASYRHGRRAMALARNGVFVIFVSTMKIEPGCRGNGGKPPFSSMGVRPRPLVNFVVENRGLDQGHRAFPGSPMDRQHRTANPRFFNTNARRSRRRKGETVPPMGLISSRRDSPLPQKINEIPGIARLPGPRTVMPDGDKIDSPTGASPSCQCRPASTTSRGCNNGNPGWPTQRPPWPGCSAGGSLFSASW